MRIYLFSVFFFILGGFSYYLTFDTLPPRDLRNYQTSTTIRKPEDNKFISPLLLAGDSVTSHVNDIFTKKISNYINTQKNAGNATDISYYVKNLRNSSWTGIEEDTHYVPASLMKVPVLIAILKESEIEPGLLKKEIYYSQKQNYNNEEYYLAKKFILNNNKYTVEELLNYMIDYSDNNATILLLSVVPQKNILQIFTDLGLPFPENDSAGTIDFLSAKLYSRLFRVLYNSTYLNEQDSAKALELLSSIDFTNGIVAGVPKEIEVADKFGERTVYDQEKNIVSRELHDCGIVYLTNNPYAICIMTKGKEFVKLEKIISDLSQMTYSEMK